MCPANSERIGEIHAESARKAGHGGHDHGSAGNQTCSAAAGMVNEDCGMPHQRDVGKSLVRRTGNPHQEVLLLGKVLRRRGHPAAQPPGPHEAGMLMRVNLETLPSGDVNTTKPGYLMIPVS